MGESIPNIGQINFEKLVRAIKQSSRVRETKGFYGEFICIIGDHIGIDMRGGFSLPLFEMLNGNKQYEAYASDLEKLLAQIMYALKDLGIEYRMSLTI